MAVRSVARWGQNFLVSLLAVAFCIVGATGAAVPAYADSSPALSTSVTSASASGGLVVSVSGANFDAASYPNGVYAALIVTGTESSVTASSGYAAVGYVPSFTDGAFTTSLTAATSALDSTKNYTVLVWKARTYPTSDTIIATEPVTVTAEQWRAIFPPQISTSVTGVSKTGGLTVDVTGSLFTGISGAYAAIIEQGTEASMTASSGYAAFGYWADGFSAGTFTKSLTAQTSALDSSKTYEVIVWQLHALPTASTIYARSTIDITASDWATLFPTVPTVSTSVTSASASSGLVVSVSGANFDAASYPNGVYAALIVTGTESSVTASSGYAAVGYVPSFTDGAFTTSLTAATSALDSTKNYTVLVWKAHTLPTSDTIIATEPVTITTTQWATLFPSETSTGSDSGSSSSAGTPATTAPTSTTTTDTASTTAESSGTLIWGVKSSFRSYVTGSIAQGSIAKSTDVGYTNGQFSFPQSGTGAYSSATGEGGAPYSGTVNFSGHGGLLNITIANPEVRIVSKTTANLWATVNGTRMILANLALGTAELGNDGSTTFTNAAATLTAAGATAFGGFYAEGTSLDPVTFTIGTKAATTIASSSAVSQISGAAWVSSTAATAGTTATAETSTATIVNGCTVSNATLTWGVKESFRAYIDGSIANGSWTTADGATYSTPNFTWSSGSGSIDSATPAASIAWPGSVTFTGHSGALNLQLSNPTLSIVNASTAYLLVDVKNTTMAGAVVDEKQIPLVAIDLSTATFTPRNGVVTAASLPTTLTAEGAAAFGTYQQGEEFDPITLTLPVASTCQAASVASEAGSDESSSDAAVLSSDDTPVAGNIVAPAIVVIVIVIALVLLAILLLRRRKAITK